MIGLALLMIAMGTIGWKMNGFIQKKQFYTDLRQLNSRCLTLRKMAISMQADWEATLKPKEKNWVFETVCLDLEKQIAFPPIKLRGTDVLLNGKELNMLKILFFSSGKIEPHGSLFFRGKAHGQTETWDFPKIFGMEEGDGVRSLGPVHPDEISF
jgi:hypothetical protein